MGGAVGGAVNTFANAGKNPLAIAGRVAAGVLTMGTTELGTMAYRAYGGYGTQRRAPAEAQQRAADQQRQTAADQRRQLALQPKKIAPDNYLAQRASRLATLRLGLASTITGAGGAPSPILAAPSLSAVGTKKDKLGV